MHSCLILLNLERRCGIIAERQNLPQVTVSISRIIWNTLLIGLCYLVMVLKLKRIYEKDIHLRMDTESLLRGCGQEGYPRRMHTLTCGLRVSLQALNSESGSTMRMKSGMRSRKDKKRIIRKPSFPRSSKDCFYP